MRIFLDIDGVLNLFSVTLFEFLGHRIAYKDYPVECGWDIVSAWNKVSGNDWSPAKFWGSITRPMWENMPKSGICDLLLNEVQRFADKKCIALLTSPILDPDSLAGKVVWIRKELPSWLHRRYLIGPVKSMCAYPGSVLIDDSDTNIDEWVGAGGTGILVPRPWNRLHGENTWNYVRNQLEKLKDESQPLLLP